MDHVYTAYFCLGIVYILWINTIQYLKPHIWLDFLSISWESSHKLTFIFWLVLWNILYVSISWECHHPNWRTRIFQRRWNHQPEHPSDVAAVGSRYVAPVDYRPEIGPAPPLERRGRYQLECQILLAINPVYIHSSYSFCSKTTWYGHCCLMIHMGCMDTVICIWFIWSFLLGLTTGRYCNITPKAGKMGKVGQVLFVLCFLKVDVRYVVLLSCQTSSGIKFSARSTSDVYVVCWP